MSSLIEPAGLARVVADWPQVLEPALIESPLRVLYDGRHRRSTRRVGPEPHQTTSRLFRRVDLVTVAPPMPTTTADWLTDPRVDSVHVVLERGTETDEPVGGDGAALPVEIAGLAGTITAEGFAAVGPDVYRVAWQCPGELLGYEEAVVSCRLVVARPPTSPLRVRVVSLAPYVRGRAEMLARWA